MLNRTLRGLFMLVISGVIGATVILAVGTPSARADGFGVLVECDPSEAGCRGEVRTGQQSPGGPGNAGGGASASECRDGAGRPAECVHPEFGWLGGDGCWYDPVEWPAEQTAALPGGPANADDAGGWYSVTCAGSGPGQLIGSVVWVPGAAPVSAGVLARQAASEFTLPSLSIGSSPSGTQLVRVPTWLWVDASRWAAQSATASVPGLSVTVTATPTRVVWSMGDGGSVVCPGPGSVFPAGGDPAASSPDCGHTYTRSSAGVPGQAYPVTATVTWEITWTGGGEQGTLPALETTSTTVFRVAESQALIEQALR